MRKSFKNVKYVVGDVRDKDFIDYQVQVGEYDAVFLVAALKHVDVLEFNPEEAVKTNILGTMNVAESCIKHKVKYCVFSSTDKAVNPINAYGGTKFVAEKILFNKNRLQEYTHFSVFRWGNILGSRGSVIPFFAEKMKNGEEVPITDLAMTRFWLTIEDACKFMISNFQSAKKDRAMIPPLKSSGISEVIKSISRLTNKTSSVRIVGLRPGEKIHEEMWLGFDSNKCDKYSNDELDFLIKPVLEGA